MPSRILVVAYGNPLRSDDGVGWRVAGALQGKFPPDQVEILRLHQLAPELAESIGHSQLVVFLDAATSEPDGSKPGEIRVREIQGKEGNGSSGFCHAFSPTNVLALAKQLYGASPHAYVISMSGENFSHGESLSAAAELALPHFVARAEQLIRERLQMTPNS